jgi:outer membrane protein assembly factor BamB
MQIQAVRWRKIMIIETKGQRILEYSCDLCVVGGGLAGMSAAIEAARKGIKVVLIQDRPVLGGNASSEIRMWVRGAKGLHNRETGIISELEEENIYRNPRLNYSLWDTVLYEKVKNEKNIRLLLNCTCLDAETGAEIWRTNQYKVRETVGLSHDSSMVYSKCMWDTVVAISTADPIQTNINRPAPETLWVSHAGFGYEHNPAMPLEQGGVLWVCTKNGLLLGLNAQSGEVLWRHKIGNSILNTPLPLSATDCIVTSSEGTITYIRTH